MARAAWRIFGPGARYAAASPDLPRKPRPTTEPAPIVPIHALTAALLATRYATAVATHAPTPVFGGGVRLPGPIAALLCAQPEGAGLNGGFAKAAKALWRDADGDPDFGAVTDPAIPRELPGFTDLATRCRTIWPPFPERPRVVAPV